MKIPFVCGSGAYAYTYKMHWQGAQHWFINAQNSPKKRLLFNGPAHMERPFHDMHDDIIRWYDHWLKGIDNGVENDPPVKVWVMGENKWRTYSDWPVPETQWTKFYLDSWERLTTEEPLPLDQTQSYNPDPDVFTQMPLKKTMKVERLRYMTEPLADDLLVVGPCSLTIHAALDQDDTNWIIALSDVGPDVSVRTQREGERFVPGDLPERELTRGWLKASHRALDPERSKPWAPFHKLTREAQQPVVPGEINEYQIEIALDGEHVPARTPHLRGHHEPRRAHGHRRPEQHRVHRQPRVQQQDRDAQRLPQRGVPVAPAAAGDTAEVTHDRSAPAGAAPAGQRPAAARRRRAARAASRATCAACSRATWSSTPSPATSTPPTPASTR